MMEVTCDKCGKIYRIDEHKLQKKLSKLGCKTCGHVIRVEKPEPSAHVPEQESFSEATIALSREPDTDAPAAGFATGVEPHPLQSGVRTAPIKEWESESAGKPFIASQAIKRIPWTNRIQVRITAILILLTTIILFIFGFLNYHLTKSKMDKELSLFAEITTTRLAKNIVEPFWALDDDLLKDTIHSEMMDKQIYGILIRDRDDKAIYIGRKRGLNWKIVETLSDIKDSKMTLRRMNITKENDKIGAVEVYLTPEFMQQELKASTTYIIITVVILNLVLFVSIYSILKKVIILPIMNLTEAAEQMSMGDLDVKFGAKPNNEIGLLVKAIERMQTSLKFAMERFGS